MKSSVYAALFVLSPLIFSAKPVSEGVPIDSIPSAAETTVESPVKLLMPAEGKIAFTAIENKQKVQMLLLNRSPLKKAKLAIFDPRAERVKYVTLERGAPFVYILDKGKSVMFSFESTSSATPKKDSKIKGDILIESEYPLIVKH